MLEKTHEKVKTQIKTHNLNEKYFHILKNSLLSSLATYSKKDFFVKHILDRKKQTEIQMKSCIFLKLSRCLESENFKTHSMEVFELRLIFTEGAYS